MPNKSHPYRPEDDLLTEFEGSVAAPTKFELKNTADAYRSGHLSPSALLNATRMPGADDKSESLAKLVKTGQNALEIALQPILDLQASLNTALDTFNEDFKALKEAISHPQSTVEPGTFPELVREMHAELREEIEKQHQTELDVFTAQRIQLEIAIQPDFGVDPTQAKAIAEECLSKLKSSHKKQLEDFDKGAKEAHANMLQTAQKEYRRLNILNTLYNTQKAFKKAIDEAYRPKVGAADVVEGGARNESDLFKDVDLDNLPGDAKLTTVTGTALTKDGKNLSLTIAPLSYALGEMKYGLFNKGASKREHDLLGLAYTMRAQGAEKITMTVTCSDPEKAMELARKSYEACILAGYKPEDITIKGPDKEGKTKTLMDGAAKTPLLADAELFAGQAERLKIIHARGEQIQREEKALTTTHLTSQEARAKLTALKTTTAAATAARQAAPAPGADNINRV